MTQESTQQTRKTCDAKNCKAIPELEYNAYCNRHQKLFQKLGDIEGFIRIDLQEELADNQFIEAELLGKISSLILTTEHLIQFGNTKGISKTLSQTAKKIHDLSKQLRKEEHEY